MAQLWVVGRVGWVVNHVYMVTDISITVAVGEKIIYVMCEQEEWWTIACRLWSPDD